MNPKEKANELVDRFNFRCRDCDNAVESALIAVYEIMATNTLIGLNCGFLKLEKRHLEYWQEVEKELVNLNK